MKSIPATVIQKAHNEKDKMGPKVSQCANSLWPASGMPNLK